MSDFRPDPPAPARLYCPGCEPEADPFAEILDVHWCDAHVPSRDGTDDATVTPAVVVSGSAEAGGECNRRWCELLHREASPSARRRPRRAPAEALRADGVSAPGRDEWPRSPDAASPAGAPPAEGTRPAP